MNLEQGKKACIPLPANHHPTGSLKAIAEIVNGSKWELHRGLGLVVALPVYPTIDLRYFIAS